MIEDMAVDMRTARWSAIGGRVLTPESPPSGGDAAQRPAPRHRPQPELRGHVSFATSDGLLGPGRRLRYRRVHWLKASVAWLALVLLVPLVAGWAWGLLGGLAR